MSTDDLKKFDVRNRRNPQSFFDKLEAGDPFQYSPALGPDEIEELADEVGEQVEYDTGMRMTYLGPKVETGAPATGSNAKGAPQNHISEAAFRRTMHGEGEYFDVYCPSCERQLDPIPEQYKTYFRQCPNDSCGRYFRVIVDHGNPDHNDYRDAATLIPARRYTRTDSGTYVSEDGAEIYRDQGRWVGTHPEMDGAVIEDTLKEARAAIDRKV